MRLQIVKGSLKFYKDLLTQDFRETAIKDYEVYKRFKKLIDLYFKGSIDIKILDVGCGRRYFLPLLFHNIGYDIVGLDILRIEPDANFLRRYAIEFFSNGFPSFLRAISNDLLRQRNLYYATLKSFCDYPLSSSGMNIVCMNAEKIAFPDESFDCIISNAVFEHISHHSMPKVVSELYRILKIGGYTFIRIHPFTSLDGGHHPDISKVPPWDHLRNNKWPTPVYLNKLRIHEYLDYFHPGFKIIEVQRETTEQAKSKLVSAKRGWVCNYSEEELLAARITIIAQKETRRT